MNTLRNLAVTAVAVAALAVTGCSASNVVTKSSDLPPAPVTSSAPAPTKTTAPAATFGDKVTFPSGVSVVVTAASTPADKYAIGAVDGKIVVVKIAITNGSAKSVSGFLPSIPKVSYGAQGVQADRAMDIQVADTKLVSTVQPGETQTALYTAGVPVAEFGTVRVEVPSPNIGEDPAIVKGPIK